MQFLPACRFVGMFLLVPHFEGMAEQVLPASHSEDLEQIEGGVVLLACWPEENLTSAAAEKEWLILAAYYPAGKVTPCGAAVWAAMAKKNLPLRIRK